MSLIWKLRPDPLDKVAYLGIPVGYHDHKYIPEIWSYAEYLRDILGKAMRQLPVPDVSCCAQVLQVRGLTLCDTFHGRHCHGLHALPISGNHHT